MWLEAGCAMCTESSTRARRWSLSREAQLCRNLCRHPLSNLHIWAEFDKVSDKVFDKGSEAGLLGQARRWSLSQEGSLYPPLYRPLYRMHKLPASSYSKS